MGVGNIYAGCYNLPLIRFETLPNLHIFYHFFSVSIVVVLLKFHAFKDILLPLREF